MQKKLIYIVNILYFLYPSLTFAVSFNLAGSNIKGVVDYLISIFSILNPILFSLCFIVFFWGLSKFILNSDSKDQIEKGKSYMFWGVVVLFILVSIRAIIMFISGEFGFGTTVNVPYIPHG